MIPIRFAVEDGVTTFYYKTRELKNFVRLGKKDGNVGMILIHRKGNMLTYKGFGTIEHPMTEMVTLSMMHHPGIDGEMKTDEQRLEPSKFVFNRKNYKFVMLDLSKG